MSRFLSAPRAVRGVAVLFDVYPSPSARRCRRRTRRWCPAPGRCGPGRPSTLPTRSSTLDDEVAVSSCVGCCPGTPRSASKACAAPAAADRGRSDCPWGSARAPGTPPPLRRSAAAPRHGGRTVAAGPARQKPPPPDHTRLEPGSLHAGLLLDDPVPHPDIRSHVERRGDQQRFVEADGMRAGVDRREIGFSSGVRRVEGAEAEVPLADHRSVIGPVLELGPQRAAGQVRSAAASLPSSTPDFIRVAPCITAGQERIAGRRAHRRRRNARR